MIFISGELKTLGERINYINTMFYNGNVNRFAKDCNVTNTRLGRWLNEENPDLNADMIGALILRGFNVEWILFNKTPMFSNTEQGRQLETQIRERLKEITKFMSNEPKGIYRTSLED